MLGSFSKGHVTWPVCKINDPHWNCARLLIEVHSRSRRRSFHMLVILRSVRTIEERGRPVAKAFAIVTSIRCWENCKKISLLCQGKFECFQAGCRPTSSSAGVRRENSWKRNVGYVVVRYAKAGTRTLDCLEAPRKNEKKIQPVYFVLCGQTGCLDLAKREPLGSEEHKSSGWIPFVLVSIFISIPAFVGCSFWWTGPVLRKVKKSLTFSAWRISWSTRIEVRLRMRWKGLWCRNGPKRRKKRNSRIFSGAGEMIDNAFGGGPAMEFWIHWRAKDWKLSGRMFARWRDWLVERRSKSFFLITYQGGIVYWDLTSSRCNYNLA